MHIHITYFDCIICLVEFLPLKLVNICTEKTRCLLANLDKKLKLEIHIYTFPVILEPLNKFNGSLY